MMDNYSINMDEMQISPEATNIKQNRNEVFNHFQFLQSLYVSLKSNVDIIKNDLDRFMTNYAQGSGNENIRNINNHLGDIQKSLIQVANNIDRISSETDKFQNYLITLTSTQPDILEEVKFISSMVSNQVDKDTVHQRKSEHLESAIANLSGTVSTTSQLDQNFTELRLAITDIIRSIDIIHPLLQKSDNIDSSISELSKTLSELKPLTNLQKELQSIAKFFKLATKPLGIIVITFTLLLSLMAASAGLYKIIKLFKLPPKIEIVEK